MANLIPIKPDNARFNDDQWQAIHQRGSNILVSASAGSGKTTVLIERLFNHLMTEFASVDELLVVTFTEAAAGEMKERMESKLKEMINQTADGKTRQYLVEQLRKLPTSHIRTLHSFCLRVIEQFFYLIDFNPSFKLMTDETQKALMYQEVWHQLVEEETSHHLDRYMNLLSIYGETVNDEALFNLIVSLHHFASSHPEPNEWLKTVDNLSRDFEHFTNSTLYQDVVYPNLKSRLLISYQLLTHSLDLLKSCQSETVEKYEGLLLAEQQQVANLLEHLAAGDLKTVFNEAQTLSFGRWPSNRDKESSDYETIQEMKKLRDDAKKNVEDKIKPIFAYSYDQTLAVEKQVAPILKDLGQLTLTFRKLLWDYKVENNVIDYNDLEHLTLNILAPYDEQTKKRTASPAAYYFQQLFKEILVDEYQDINDIQAAILYWLSKEPTGQSGNMFMVGDVKQSIYRFRMAEPSLFLQKYDQFSQGKGGQLIVLDTNYRSRDEVLQFTNFIFERIMDQEFGEMNYGKNEALVTGNHQFQPSAPDSKFNVQLKLHVPSVEKLETGQWNTAVEYQSHLIAQDMLQKVHHKELIYDKKTQQMRPVTWSDFVVLSSTRAPFLALQRAFEHYNIPIVSQKIENYFQRQEIQLMIALLKVIDNPLQDIAMVAVLRSYFVGLTDEQLSRIRIHQKNGLFVEAMERYYHDKKDQLLDEIERDTINKLAYFMDQLKHWQKTNQEKSLVDLIWLIYEETFYLDYVSGLTNGAQRLANLHAFYERAEVFEGMKFKGLLGFIRYIEEALAHDKDLSEPVLMEEDLQAVRLMTVHASKGLEFPIVYLMNIEKGFNLRDIHQTTLASKDYGLASHYLDVNRLLKFRSFLKESFVMEEIRKEKAEEMRKLYVALTRCEQQLILVGTIKDEDTWEDKKDQINQMTPKGQKQVATYLRESANSWLDWIQQGISLTDIHPQSVASFNLSQLDEEYIDEQSIETIYNSYHSTTQQSKKEWVNELFQEFSDYTKQQQTPLNKELMTLLENSYSFDLATKTSSYQSVSELKRLYEEPMIDKIQFFEDRRNLLNEENDQLQAIRYTEDTFAPPQFMQEKRTDAAQRGTITHYFLQLLNFEAFQKVEVKDYENQLKDQLQKIVAKKELTSEQANQISLDGIVMFLQSHLGQRIIHAPHQLQKEQAFSYLLPARTIFKHQIKDHILNQLDDNQLLVHGIIDGYIVTSKGIILFDYKTDRYRSNFDRQFQIDDLIKKYRFQLSLYAQALETALHQPVLKAYLVLLDFNKVIEVDSLIELTTQPNE